MPQAAERLKGDKALLMQRIDRLIIDLEQILVDRAVQELLDLLVVVKAVPVLAVVLDDLASACSSLGKSDAMIIPPYALSRACFFAIQA